MPAQKLFSLLTVPARLTRRRERGLQPFDIYRSLRENSRVRRSIMPKATAYLLIALLALVLILLGGGEQLAQSQSATGKLQPLAVHYSPLPGVYNETISVQMTPTDPRALVYFTTDGSLPSPENGTLYTDPVVLSPRPSQVAALRAVAVLPDGQTSPAQAATYVLGMDTAVPVSLADRRPD